MGINATRLKEVTRIAEEGIRANAYPGCQIVVAKDGIIVYNRSFGCDDYVHRRPVTNMSVYDLASSSKATGTLLAVMKAYDERKFKMSDPVSTFITELQKSDKKNIQIKELLFHQSGLVPSIFFHTKAMNKGKFIPELLSETPKENYTLKVANRMFLHTSFQDTVLQMIKRSKLGTKMYRYSCVNFMLLKIMVERQLHQPMDSLLTQDFFFFF